MNDFLKEQLLKIAGYKGRILGSGVGLIAGLIWAFLGFWRAVAFLLCIIIGYYLGKKSDERVSLRDLIHKIFPPNE